MNQRKRQFRGSRIGFALVLFAALASLVPFGFLVWKSLVPPEGGRIGDLWGQVFDALPVGLYMMNSVIVAGGSTAVVLLVSTLAGFAFAKLEYSGSKIVFGLVVAAISVPLATTILPNYLNFARLGGIETFWAPIVVYSALALPFSTILMTAFFRSVPDEIVESAVIDGASYSRIYSLIMLPMARPAIVTVGVLSFIAAWNDLLISLLFLPGTEMRTISVGIAALQGVRVSNLDVVLTGALISAIPTVVLFIIFQRHLVAGITSGISK